MKKILLFTALLTLLPLAAFASADTPEINSGDTAWVLISTAMVLLMTPGLAFFYGGMVRRKNILEVLMKCFITMGVLSLQWVIIGYSLAFSPTGKFIGGFEYAFLNNVTAAPGPYAATIPHLAFMMFQGMFAIITPALIIGAFVERMKFSSFLLFTIIWATFVYVPVCHWVWSKAGWLAGMGALDFAGGTVVHINAGIAALVSAIFIGKRRHTEHGPTPHSLPLTVLGTALLWFGWFGFNAGSSLAANGIAANAFVVTNTAAAAAAVSWAVIEWLFTKKPTMLGTASGAVAGLVAITPAAGFVGVIPAIIIGFSVSAVCYFAVSVLKPKLGYDDSLDAFGVHGIGGIWGALLTGVFASTAVNPAGFNGLLNGNPKQLWIQLVTTVVTLVYSFVMTFVIYKLVNMVSAVRVAEKDEMIGLDLAEHNERAYTLVE